MVSSVYSEFLGLSSALLCISVTLLPVDESLPGSILRLEAYRMLRSVLKFLQQPQNSTLWGLTRFAANSLSPLLLQLFETTLGLVTKTVKQLQLLVCSEEPPILFVKLGLVNLLKAFQHLLEGVGRVNKHRPFAIPQDKLMDGLAALNLTLAREQATKEGFQLSVGAVACGPGVAGE